jgi:hypothetical protein
MLLLTYDSARQAILAPILLQELVETLWLVEYAYRRDFVLRHDVELDAQLVG